MRPPDIEGGPPAEGRPKTSPNPASPPKSIAGVTDTTPQATLDEYLTDLGRNARDHGLRVAVASDAEWCDRVNDWIYALPAGARFTADTIRTEHGSSRATGSVIRSCARRRIIVRVGYTESTSPTRHAGTIAIWERT